VAWALLPHHHYLPPPPPPPPPPHTTCLPAPHHPTHTAAAAYLPPTCLPAHGTACTYLHPTCPTHLPPAFCTTTTYPPTYPAPAYLHYRTAYPPHTVGGRRQPTCPHLPHTTPTPWRHTPSQNLVIACSASCGLVAVSILALKSPFGGITDAIIHRGNRVQSKHQRALWHWLWLPSEVDASLSSAEGVCAKPCIIRVNIVNRRIVKHAAVLLRHRLLIILRLAARQYEERACAFWPCPRAPPLIACAVVKATLLLDSFCGLPSSWRYARGI